MKHNPKPIKVRTVNGDDAWAYINNASLDIYIAKEGNQTLSARLTKKQIEKILAA